MLLTLLGVALDAFYQSSPKAEPTDIRLQVFQGVPLSTSYEVSTKCNEQRLKVALGRTLRSGDIDFCAEAEKIATRDRLGGGRYRAVFSNKGPQIMENLAAELLVELEDGAFLKDTLVRVAMGLDEYERLETSAQQGFIRAATLCLSYDQPWGRRRHLVYTLTTHERHEGVALLMGDSRNFQLRRSTGSFFSRTSECSE